MALFRNDGGDAPAGSSPSAPPRAASAPSNPAEQHNIIGKTTVIEGTLRANGNVHVSGTVNGALEVDGRTVVMPGGLIDGEMRTTSAEVGGTIRGTVEVLERLVLKATAVVEGDIRTDKLVVEDGAVFNGRCEMGVRQGASRGGSGRSGGKRDKARAEAPADRASTDRAPAAEPAS